MKVLVFTLFFFALPALAQTTRQLASHNHGEAELNVVIDGNQISLALLSPAANIVGFEHAVKNAEQQEKIDNAREMLSNAAAVFQFSPAAQCEVDTTSVHWTLEKGADHDEHKEHDEHDEHKEHDEHDEHKEHDEHDEHEEHDEHDEHKEHDEHDEHKEHDEHDEHDDSTHSEFDVEYLFTCADATLVKSIEVKLFEQFPLFEKIRVQAVSAEAQFFDELTAGDSTIKVTP